MEEEDDETLEDAEVVDDEDETEEADEADTDESVDEDESEDEEAPPAEGRSDQSEGKDRRRGLEAAAAAERKKRQETQRQLDEVSRELAYIKGQLSQKASPPPAEEPEEEDEPIDLADIDGSVNKRVEKRARRLLTRAQREQAQREVSEWDERVKVSEREARDEHEDYDEVSARFLRRVTTDPGLQRLVRAQADPAEWVYQNQTRYDRRQTKGDGKVSELEAKVAELEAKLAGKQKPAGSRSLASARGAGPRPRASVGPTDPNSVFSDVFRKGA